MKYLVMGLPNEGGWRLAGGRGTTGGQSVSGVLMELMVLKENKSFESVPGDQRYHSLPVPKICGSRWNTTLLRDLQEEESRGSQVTGPARGEVPFREAQEGASPWRSLYLPEDISLW